VITSALGSALQGIYKNQMAMTRHADRISRFGTEDISETDENISLESEMVGILQAKRGIEANTAVIKTEDEMLGTLIDMLA